MAVEESVRWSDVFGRSTFGPATWTDRHELGDLRGAPAGSWSGMFSGSRRWKRFADGGWDRYDNYTWSDAPHRGSRIHGWAAMRFICAINGITPPTRRLKGEPFVPDTEILVTAVYRQLIETGASNGHGMSRRGSDAGNGRYSAPIDPLGGEQERSFWADLERLHDTRPASLRLRRIGER